MAAENMEKAGFAFERIPLDQMFLVDGRCTVPPHFRPLCSLHQCKIGGMGLDPADPKWTKEYFDLRERLNDRFVE
jgi:hypothetical protein